MRATLLPLSQASPRDLARGTLLLLTASMLGGCAGFKAIDRGEWEVVWTKENAAKAAEEKLKLLQGYGGFGQEVVPREQYDEELTEGIRRKVEPLAGVKASLLTELEGKVSLAVGELRVFRLDETREPVLTWQGSGLEVYLTQPKRVDGWKGDEAVDGREAMLILVGTKAGKATFQLEQGQEKKTVEVTVTPKEKK